MTIYEQKIKNFFEEEIFDLDEDEVDTFLNGYSSEKVIECLIEKLKFLATFQYGDEWAWRLGRDFCSISNKYSADTQVYSLLNTSNLAKKKIMLHFLSGYWYGDIDANLEIVVKIAEEIIDTIANFNNLKWNQELIFVAIEAVAIGYLYNEQLLKVKINIENQLKQRLKTFKTYISNVAPKSPAHQLLLNLED